MNTDLLKKVEGKYLKNSMHAFNVGDTVTVHNIIREGEKSRVQKFKGTVIAKAGSGTRAMFTVRKISDGIGVEKIFPVNSPNVEKIEINKHGKVRRSKIYYLRDRVGKSALKVKETDRVVLKEEVAPAVEDVKVEETPVVAEPKSEEAPVAETEKSAE